MFDLDLDLPEAKEEASATTRAQGKAVVFPAFWSGKGDASAAAKTEEAADGEAHAHALAKANAKAALAAAAANDVANPWVGGSSAADDSSNTRAPAISTLDALAAKQDQERRGKRAPAESRGAPTRAGAGAGARGRAPQMDDDERHELVAAMFAKGGAVDAREHFSKLKETTIREEMEDEDSARGVKRKKDSTLNGGDGLSGWGDWAGEGAQKPSARTMKRRKTKKAARDAVSKATFERRLSKRKDAKLPNVIISERRDKGLAQYKVKDVPYPFTSREQYEKVRAPTWFGSRPRAEALLPPAPHRALVFLTHSLSIARSCCLLRVPRVASPRRSPRRADLLRTANPPGRLYPATDAAPTDWERLEHDKLVQGALSARRLDARRHDY
jgi:hypothetical protein